MSVAGLVLAVAADGSHRFAKRTRESIALLAGLGVEGDAHAGRKVQHRSRVARTPDAPNLRQVHLLQSELFADLAAAGFAVSSGQMGENVTTAGVDLLALAGGTRLRLGREAVIEITGLRNPCRQIDDNLGRGAMTAALSRAADGALVRKAGIMAIVVTGGIVRPGDPIALEFRPAGHRPLEPV